MVGHQRQRASRAFTVVGQFTPLPLDGDVRRFESKENKQKKKVKMAPSRPGGGSSGVLSSVIFQLLARLTSGYLAFYFLSTLSLIIWKSLVLSYPSEALAWDVGLLFLLAALDLLRLFCGVRGTLTESELYILVNLFVTGTTILLTVYFLAWQTYVMRADVIISSVLLSFYGFDGVLALSTLVRLTRSDKD
ncbi:transmembrane protein 80-like [Brachionichthys hirsutus]|uniref:transmembrane protein 80-like n=1 Tax=Brachionichthys hirsutus TaxID=412623 RepID=UPI00360533B8